MFFQLVLCYILMVDLAALSNVTENCSFQPGVRYCGQYFQGSRPVVPDVIIGLPIRVSNL